MAFDRWLVRHTGFSLVSLQYALAGRFPYNPTLLLLTTGRKSGATREAALPFVEYDGGLVVIGSKGGGPKDPDWAVNLRHTPTGRIILRRKEIPVIAEVLDRTIAPALFEHVVAHKVNVARYAERAESLGRQIPLVVLRSADGRRLTRR